jgi:transposase
MKNRFIRRYSYSLVEDFDSFVLAELVVSGCREVAFTNLDIYMWLFYSINQEYQSRAVFAL